MLLQPQAIALLDRLRERALRLSQAGGSASVASEGHVDFCQLHCLAGSGLKEGQMRSYASTAIAAWPAYLLTTYNESGTGS